MERWFKVYVYLEGEELLVYNGFCKEIYVVEGRFIQELQGDNFFVIYDLDNVYVYFFFFSVVMMVVYFYEKEFGDMDLFWFFVGDYVDVLMYKYLFWNWSGGVDYFMFLCYDWGLFIMRENMNLGMRFICVLCNVNFFEGYVLWKDVSFLEIYLVGGYIFVEFGGFFVKDRLYLVFFVGCDYGFVCFQLFKYWEGKDDDVIVY